MSEMIEEPAPDPQSRSLFRRSRAELAQLYAADRQDFLRTAQSLWLQRQTPLERSVGLLSEQRLIAPQTSLSDDLAQIDRWLRDLPTLQRAIAHDPSHPGQVRLYLGADLPPPIAKILTYWEVLFGHYHEDPPHPRKAEPIYLPIFDYHVTPDVAKALEVSVYASLEDETSAKVSLKVKRVGLLGSARFKVTKSLTTKARLDTFQIVVPVWMKLTRYRNSQTGEHAYTADCDRSGGPMVARVTDTGVYLPLAPPQNGTIYTGRFINSDAHPDVVEHVIETESKVEASAALPMPEGWAMSVDYTARTAQELRVELKKLRQDVLEKRTYEEMGIRLEVFQAPD